MSITGVFERRRITVRGKLLGVTVAALARAAGASREVARSVFFNISYPTLEYLGSIVVYGPEDRLGGPAYKGYYEATDLQALAKAQGGHCLNGRYEVYWKGLPAGMNAARFRSLLLSRWKTAGYAVRSVAKPPSI